MNRIVKFLVFCLMAMAIFGFAKPANAFNALNEKANLSILEIESKVTDIFFDRFLF